MLLLAISLFCFGLMMPNFNAIAMEPMGRIAGTASSFIGALTTALAALGGYWIGRAFDGSVDAAARRLRGRRRCSASRWCSSPSAAGCSTPSAAEAQSIGSTSTASSVDSPVIAARNSRPVTR